MKRKGEGWTGAAGEPAGGGEQPEKTLEKNKPLRPIRRTDPEVRPSA
jgi:hypothetical protein